MATDTSLLALRVRAPQRSQYAASGTSAPPHTSHAACTWAMPALQYATLELMELQEEMTAADVVLLLSSVPERIGDQVLWLDEARLRYRHGPAFPTVGNLIAHLVE